jgi:hypothetical protein
MRQLLVGTQLLGTQKNPAIRVFFEDGVKPYCACCHRYRMIAAFGSKLIERERLA